MKCLDRLSGEDMATLGSLFDAHPSWASGAWLVARQTETSARVKVS